MANELGRDCADFQVFADFADDYLYYQRDWKSQFDLQAVESSTFGISESALLKALFLATEQATKKWTIPIKNWG